VGFGQDFDRFDFDKHVALDQKIGDVRANQQPFVKKPGSLLCFNSDAAARQLDGQRIFVDLLQEASPSSLWTSQAADRISYETSPNNNFP